MNPTPDSFALFSLKSANAPAGETVFNFCRGRSRVLSFRSDQIARAFPRAFGAIGHVVGTDDIILKPCGVIGTQCFFVITPAGDVMLCDCSATPLTILSTTNREGLLQPKYVLRWPGDSCVLPMSRELMYRISFCSGELFELCWDLDMHWDVVQATRAALSRQYGWRAERTGAMGLPFPVTARGIVEPVTDMTPRIGGVPIPARAVKETHDYRIIGEGHSGFVHQTVDIHDGRQYAVKSINPRKIKDDWARFVKAAVQFKTEVESLAVLDHPNIVKVMHSQGWSNERTIQVFMMLWRGNAASLVSEHRCDEKVCTENSNHFPAFLVDCLGALAYLHKKGLIHRDVKLTNILFAPRPTGLQFALSDFGVARVDAGAQGHFGDRVYTPPELADRQGLASAASDMYGFGVAILEFLGVVCRDCYYVGEEQWRARMEASGYAERYEDVSFPREAHFCYARMQYLRVNSRIAPTVKRMLEPDPGLRPSAEDALLELAAYYEFDIPARFWACG